MDPLVLFLKEGVLPNKKGEAEKYKKGESLMIMTDVFSAPLSRH